MPSWTRRGRARDAALVEAAVASTLEKLSNGTVANATRGARTHAIDYLPTNEDGSPRTTADVNALQDRLGSSGGRAVPMPRPASEFGAVLGPAAPYIPSPLDPVDPVTGRAMPRRYEYQVAINLDLTRRRVPWTVLRSLMDDCDLIHRCGEIRISEIVGLEWDFAVSDHAISRIMADNQISISEAQKIGRKIFAADVDRQKALWENPDQNADVGFAEWLAEALDQHFTYDAVCVYPRYNLGGALIGLEIIDAPTIKVLRDNRGGLPMPPYPAYQQILWGFPRGEFHASSGVPAAQQFLSDQLSYFVRNRKTATPYGYSVVEESMAAATIYMERQAWMRGEYTQATTPPTFIETSLKAEETNPQQLAQWELVVNDKLAGQTAERLRHKLLPDGFHPVQMQMINERYTADYDEFLIKQVGSKWGIAPTQLGVIPRTGLSGRGQQDGEQDQADTMSKRPTEYWLADVINSLSRRYLGTTRDTTITFNDPQTSDNDLAVAQAQAARIGSAARTVNQIAIENGDPPFDMPECDEPFVVTATGPVFLRGLLERQQREPTAPVAVGFGGSPPPTGSAPTPDALPSGADSLADEAAKFVKFAMRRIADDVPWRDFAFEKVDSATAAKLNEAGRAGDIALIAEAPELAKAGGVGPKVTKAEADYRPTDSDTVDCTNCAHVQRHDPKASTCARVIGTVDGDHVCNLFLTIKAAKALGDSRPGAGGEREQPLTEHYHAALSEAMGLGLDPQGIALDWKALNVAKALGVYKATVPEDLSVPNAGADGPALHAAAAFVMTLQADSQGMTDVFSRLYPDAYAAGAKAGLDKLAEADIDAPGTELARAVQSVDWDTWTPGDPPAAAQLASDGLSRLLARAAVEIKRINGTTLGDLSEALATGVREGQSIDQIANAIDGVLHNPARAEMIARTEVNRAMTHGDLDTYRQAGLTQFDWLDSPGACPLCKAEVDENPHQLGDDAPPKHPNCRCATLPVVGTN